jgi:tetraacyldisaccharide 4'-kinase
MQAKRDGLTLVTTEKDFVKLQTMPAAADIVPFAVTLAFEDKPALQAFVIERLNQARVKSLRS